MLHVAEAVANLTHAFMEADVQRGWPSSGIYAPMTQLLLADWWILSGALCVRNWRLFTVK